MKFFLLTLTGFAAAANHPYLMNMFSSSAVEYAVENRMSNVASASASDMAKKIVEGALAPPQVTSLMQSAENVAIRDGNNVNPSDLLKLAQDASQAYGEMKASSGFVNYLHYVSANAHHFDVKKMFSLPNNQQGTQMNAAIQQQLTSLEQTAAGREAVQTFEGLMKEIEHDVGVTLPRLPHQV